MSGVPWSCSREDMMYEWEEYSEAMQQERRKRKQCEKNSEHVHVHSDTSKYCGVDAQTCPEAEERTDDHGSTAHSDHARVGPALHLEQCPCSRAAC